MRVLVVGATSSIGHLAVEEAIRQGHTVRGLVRDTKKARRLPAGIEEFGNIIARGGSGVVISSQSGHRLPALTIEQNKALALTPADELLKLPFLQRDQVKDSLHAYQLSKRGNSLRVMAEAVHWGKRGARINTISPGIVMTPLAKDELSGPRVAGYRRMIEGSVANGPGPQTKSVPSARCSWGQMAASPQAVTSSWMAA